MKGVIWSLFDGSGYALKDWADAGFKCYAFNANDGDHGAYETVRVKHPNITYVDCWIDEEFVKSCMELWTLAPDLIMSFAPCTDLTNAGSRHWDGKREKNPRFQEEAIEMCRIVETLGLWFNCPWFLENPVGVMSSMWRKPDHIFHPFEYGGYLRSDDEHPAFPYVIPARDSYRKRTCIWCGNGYKMPGKFPVDYAGKDNPGWKKLGGKSARTKLIRSLTPRGFAKASFLANSTK